MRSIVRRVQSSLEALTPFPDPMKRSMRGCELLFHPRTSIGHELRREGAFEAAEIDLATALYLSHFRHEARYVLDVGANIGVHALCWARALPQAAIHAVEPAPDTFDLLTRNIRGNGLADRIRTHHCAVSDAEGEAAFFVAVDDAYSSLKDTRRKRIKETIRVRSRTLDSLAQELPGRAGLVKIDVEGFEEAVVRGGRAFLRRDRPVLFVEIYGGTHSNAAPERTIGEIAGLGYDVFVFGPAAGLRPFVRHDDAAYNYFFLPRVE